MNRARSDLRGVATKGSEEEPVGIRHLFVAVGPLALQLRKAVEDAEQRFLALRTASCLAD